MARFNPAVTFGVFAAALMTSEAASAGCITPAPVAGIGVGAILLLGAGYRMLSKRLDR